MGGTLYLNLEYAYMNLSLSLYLYIYIVGAKKCLEPRIIYIYLFVYEHMSTHTWDADVFVSRQIWKYNSLHKSTSIAHKLFYSKLCSNLGRFFQIPRRLTSSQVFRAPPEVTPSISPRDGWMVEGGNKLFGRFMDPGHVKKNDQISKGFCNKHP